MRQLFKRWMLWVSVTAWSGTALAMASQGALLAPGAMTLLENTSPGNVRMSENAGMSEGGEQQEGAGRVQEKGIPGEGGNLEEAGEEKEDKNPAEIPDTEGISTDTNDTEGNSPELSDEKPSESGTENEDKKDADGIQKQSDTDGDEEDKDKDQSGSWLSKDALLTLAAGFGAGVLLTAAGAAGILALGKKKEGRKKEIDPAQKTVTDLSSVLADSFADSGKQHFSGNDDPVSEVSLPVLPDVSNGSVGMVHNIGRRKNQEDTFGVNRIKTGLLAVVSDGMGGLADSERVSQQAVMGMFQAGNQISPSASDNPLYEMLSIANEQVLKMLGSDQIYKSGATLLAILAGNGRFHWAAVGDSRIYLYCSHHLIQINREHIYKRQLIGEAVNKNISFSRVNTDPQKDRLVSFLGMGELKYIDGSLRPVEVRQGDKVLLMSDGIFDTISEKEIMDILEGTRNAAEAAALMEKQVVAAGNAKQDNFTCVILDF